MLKQYVTSSLFVTLMVGSVAFANVSGAISTDRFGYTGVVKRYASMADAQSGTNQVGANIVVGDRDLALYIVNDYASYDTDANIIMGSWWYSIVGQAGWGNTRGNTGVGFMQLYDADGSTDNALSMSFSDFDGTHWTKFNLQIQGSNAGAADYARLSAIDNVNDGGIWHNYSLNLTASGLQGVQVAPGVIVAQNHPTGVTGQFSGLFELTENQTSPANQGWYTAQFTLNTTNWAWENRDALSPYSFGDSYFAVVPAPGAALLVLIGMPIIGWVKRRIG